MKPAQRDETWRPARRAIGRLTTDEFDALEVIVLLGGHVTALDYGLRVGLKRTSANTRLKRLHDGELVDRSERVEHVDGKPLRLVVYTISTTGLRMLVEAFAAMDAACEEAAA